MVETVPDRQHGPRDHQDVEQDHDENQSDGQVEIRYPGKILGKDREEAVQQHGKLEVDGLPGLGGQEGMAVPARQPAPQGKKHVQRHDEQPEQTPEVAEHRPGGLVGIAFPGGRRG